jgi:hypothetical protein
MSEVFNEREKGFEAKFKMDEELEFKVAARRNKLLGIWLAEKLGFPESEHENYAKEVVLADLEEPGVEDIVRKVMVDIEDRGSTLTEDDIRKKIDEFQNLAIKQITKN